MAGPRPTVPVTLDGTAVKAVEGETVLELCRREGVHVPTLCWLEGLSVWGGCRLCVVEVDGVHGLPPACATTVAADMELRTDTANLRGHRREIVELLFAEGNHVCAVCVANGDCELQDLAVDHGIDHVTAAYTWPDHDVDGSHPFFVFDPNRCVLCTRCVRTCDEVEGAHVWDVADRGLESRVVAGLDQPWGEVPSCTSCGKCVAVCPTGALVHKGEGVAQGQRDPDIVSFLTDARSKGTWRPRGTTPGQEATTGQATSPDEEATE